MNQYQRICLVLLLVGIHRLRICCQAFALSIRRTITNVENDRTRILTRLSLFDESMEIDKNSSDDDDDDDDNMTLRSLELPALGPAGTSSRNSNDDDTMISQSTDIFNINTTTTTTTMNNNNKNASFVTSKFCLQYTCNICEYRNRVIVSRLAYREGCVYCIIITINLIIHTIFVR